MHFFPYVPYAAPVAVPLVWAGNAVTAVLAISGLGAALLLVGLGLRARRRRVVHPAPAIRLVKAHEPVSRAAA